MYRPASTFRPIYDTLGVQIGSHLEQRRLIDRVGSLEAREVDDSGGLVDRLDSLEAQVEGAIGPDALLDHLELLEDWVEEFTQLVRAQYGEGKRIIEGLENRINMLAREAHAHRDSNRMEMDPIPAEPPINAEPPTEAHPPIKDEPRIQAEPPIEAGAPFPRTYIESRAASKEELLRSLKQAEQVIKKAARVIEKANSSIQDARETISQGQKAISAIIAEEMQEQDAAIEAGRLEVMAEHEIRLRWEGTEMLADWADVVEPGEDSEAYIDRITLLLKRRDAAVSGDTPQHSNHEVVQSKRGLSAIEPDASPSSKRVRFS
ncbi:hypothetical protein PSTT_12276 [Puccinia striiformis]|uniref:Uncharacterized protein n=1 Tax=Puccinia striiformis TaxID=27350 RepID=A0A2S4UWS7_9BASI|nr:hypothetical protein PSTT_12276 [Puccinia striiformis]